MKRIAIVDGIRTPFIKSWTLFQDLPAQHLGSLAVRELLERTGINPADIDEVIMGCVAQPVEASNVARVISLRAGIPQDKTAYTVHRNCASGFESVTSAAEKIQAGVDRVVMAGGTDNMSNAPLLFNREATNLFLKLQKAKTLGERLAIFLKFRPRHFAPVAALQCALTDPVCGLGMGDTAEVLAKEFGISRERQDRFALESHQKVAAARAKLREETMTVFLPPDYSTSVAEDNGVRENQTMEALAKLRPVFDKRSGTVTAGNSSQITDGAAALLIMEEDRARAFGYPILGTLVDYAYAGLDPRVMGLGPAHAIEKLLTKTGIKLSDIELFEINEAFAVQVLACLEALNSKRYAEKYFPSHKPVGELDPAKLNVNGGAIALGHPVGVSGARLILTCLKEMKRRNLHRGLVSLCVGGGQGGAVLLERHS